MDSRKKRAEGAGARKLSGQNLRIHTDREPFVIQIFSEPYFKMERFSHGLRLAYIVDMKLLSAKLHVANGISDFWPMSVIY